MSDRGPLIDPRKWVRYKVTAVILTVMAAVALYLYTHPSPAKLSERMIRDAKFGGVAIEPLKRFGPAALPQIMAETAGFTKLPSRSAPRVAEVLASYPSDIARETLHRLAETGRGGRPWCYLAAINELAKLGEDCSGEVDEVIDELTSAEGPMQRKAAAKTLGNMGERRAVPALIKEFRSWKTAEPWELANVIEALGKLRDRRALEPLKTAVASKDFGPGNTTAVALLRLGDKEGIALFISTLSHPYGKETTAHLLRQYTGQPFGTAPEPWEKWWQTAKETYAIPDIEPEYIDYPAEEGKIKIWLYWGGIFTVCLLASSAFHTQHRVLNRTNALLFAIAVMPLVIFAVQSVIDVLGTPYDGSLALPWTLSECFVLVGYFLLAIAFVYYAIVAALCLISERATRSHGPEAGAGKLADPALPRGSAHSGEIHPKRMERRPAEEKRVMRREDPAVVVGAYVLCALFVVLMRLGGVSRFALCWVLVAGVLSSCYVLVFSRLHRWAGLIQLVIYGLLVLPLVWPG